MSTVDMWNRKGRAAAGTDDRGIEGQRHLDHSEAVQQSHIR